jgi:hypothetical protein
MLDYANEAVNEASRRAKLIVDSTTTAICRITVASGTAVYTLDPRIIAIRRVKLASNARVLGKSVYWELDEAYPRWDESTGTVDRIVTGMDTDKIRLFRIPTVADTLQLTVVRLPLLPLAKDGDTPEINARFHRSLVYYIKHKAYNNQDSEVFDPNKADVHLAFFEQEFGPKSAAINEVFEEMNYGYQPGDGHY